MGAESRLRICINSAIAFARESRNCQPEFSLVVDSAPPNTLPSPFPLFSDRMLGHNEILTDVC